MKFMHRIMKLLLIVGALNWGLVGFFKYNLVADLFGGEASMAARFIFGLVGIAGVLSLVCLCRSCHCCKHSCGPNCNCSSCRKDKDQQ